MTRWMRLVHKWLGLLVAAQFVVWMGSGLVMALLDQQTVRGTRQQAEPAGAGAWPAGLRSPGEVIRTHGAPVLSLETGWLAGAPVYRLVDPQRAQVVDARNGAPLIIDARRAAAIAQADYAGNGALGEPVLLIEPTLEVRAHEGPIWRIDANDSQSSTVYVSAWDGRVLERRNASWRIFDVAWMLHIMDYRGRSDFNHALVIAFATGGLWLTLSGWWLLLVSLRADLVRSQRTRREALTNPAP